MSEPHREDTDDDPTLHPGPRDEGGEGGMATRELATRELAAHERADADEDDRD